MVTARSWHGRGVKTSREELECMKIWWGWAGLFLALGVQPRARGAVWPGLPVRQMALGCR